MIDVVEAKICLHEMPAVYMNDKDELQSVQYSVL